MGIGLRQLMPILIVLLVIFGSRRLKTIAADLGGAIQGFRRGLSASTHETLKEKAAQDDSTSTHV